MAEILTESYCERCGTRYTFEATARRRLGIGRIRRLSRGMRNFVVNDNTSFSEAMATAREDDTRRASSQQLDAFHLTFNFCMSCRQYTCLNCWNSGVGECLSCAPDLGADVLPPAFPDLTVVGTEANSSLLLEPVHLNVAASAWPTSDLRAAPEAAEAAGPPPAELFDPTELELAAPAAEIELTPEELAAIQSALTRHVGRPDPVQAPAPAMSEGPTGLEVTGAPQVAVPAASVVPVPSAVPVVPAARVVAEPGPPEPVAGARVETGRLLQRFRPRRDRATPVVAAEPVAAVVEPQPAVAAETVTPDEPVAAAFVAAVEPVAVVVAETQPAVVAESVVAAETVAADEPVAAMGDFAAVDAAVAAESVATVVEPQPAVAAEPVVADEPIAAMDDAADAAHEPPSVAPEPIAIEAPPEPTRPVTPAAPRIDTANQPIWTMVAPDGAPRGEPPPAHPAWSTPETITRREADAMPSASWAARVATARPLESPVWAASSRDILAAAPPGAAGPVGIQSCVSCGLSLSANARFCRRCGTRQG